MQEVKIDGKKYFKSNGKWYDEHFIEPPMSEVSKLNNKYYSNINYNNLETKEILEIANDFKQAQNYNNAIKLYERAFLKSQKLEEKEEILPKLIEIYVKAKRPSEAISLFNNSKTQYPFKFTKPEIFIHLAEAYIDASEYEYARKIAGIAYAMGDRSDELKAIYVKIKNNLK